MSGDMPIDPTRSGMGVGPVGASLRPGDPPGAGDGTKRVEDDSSSISDLAKNLDAVKQARERLELIVPGLLEQIGERGRRYPLIGS